MPTRLSLLALTVAATASCASIAATAAKPVFPEPQRLCEVLRSRAEHDGKEVMIEALFRQTPHGLMLYSEDCKQSFTHFAANDATRAVEDLVHEKPQRRIRAVVRGVFHVAHKFECFSPNCLSYKIEVAEVVSISTTEGH